MRQGWVGWMRWMKWLSVLLLHLPLHSVQSPGIHTVAAGLSTHITKSYPGQGEGSSHPNKLRRTPVTWDYTSSRYTTTECTSWGTGRAFDIRNVQVHQSPTSRICVLVLLQTSRRLSSIFLHNLLSLSIVNIFFKTHHHEKAPGNPMITRT